MRTEGRGDKVEGRREKDKLRRSRKDFAGDERTLLENKRTTLSLGGGGGRERKVSAIYLERLWPIFP